LAAVLLDLVGDPLQLVCAPGAEDDLGGIKRLHHSQVGDIELRYEGLQVASDADLTIYVYTADPGTRSAEALVLLGTLAATAAAQQPADGRPA
jgi:hypothetical protein